LLRWNGCSPPGASLSAFGASRSPWQDELQGAGNGKVRKHAVRPAGKVDRSPSGNFSSASVMRMTCRTKLDGSIIRWNKRVPFGVPNLSSSGYLFFPSAFDTLPFPGGGQDPMRFSPLISLAFLVVSAAGMSRAQGRAADSAGSHGVSMHFQQTFVWQNHTRFKSPYQGRTAWRPMNRPP